MAEIESGLAGRDCAVQDTSTRTNSFTRDRDVAITRSMQSVSGMTSSGDQIVTMGPDGKCTYTTVVNGTTTTTTCSGGSMMLGFSTTLLATMSGGLLFLVSVL